MQDNRKHHVTDEQGYHSIAHTTAACESQGAEGKEDVDEMFPNVFSVETLSPIE